MHFVENTFIIMPIHFIVIGDNKIRSLMKSSFRVSFLGNIMEPAKWVKNLGVIMDADSSMQRHMANLCCICYYHFWKRRRVYRYLNPVTAVKVANSWITVIHCFITQEGIYCKTTKSSKCLMLYCLKTRLI